MKLAMAIIHAMFVFGCLSWLVKIGTALPNLDWISASGLMAIIAYAGFSAARELLEMLK